MPPKLADPTQLAYPLLEIKTQLEWRKWLAKNHNQSTGVNFVHYKKDSGIVGVSYEEALDEALCFVWIDSTIRKIDNARYVHQFTPRKRSSFWSDVNKRKVAKLIADGKMTEHGAKLLPSMKEIEAAVKTGPAKREAPRHVDTPRFAKPGPRTRRGRRGNTRSTSLRRNKPPPASGARKARWSAYSQVGESVKSSRVTRASSAWFELHQKSVISQTLAHNVSCQRSGEASRSSQVEMTSS
jgi:hypothetical protein